MSGSAFGVLAWAHALLKVNVATLALAIALATFTLVTLGVMMGRVLTEVVGSWSDWLGGVLLMGIASLILFERLSAV